MYFTRRNPHTTEKVKWGSKLR